jgi:phosphoesterase RecJ-like protein
LGILTEKLEGKKTVVILGHVNPDGDCIGSCLGMYNYLKENFAKLSVSVCLDAMGVKFGYLKGYGDVQGVCEPGRRFDLCITLDVSDVPRLGIFAPYLESAGDSLCIDHHITNQGLAKTNVIKSEASSSCEVLYELLDEEKISLPVAECLYTGIAHDTGIFKYSNTSKKTLDITGRLIDKGIDFPTIIDRSFYMKTYGQTRLHGLALLNSRLLSGGRLIYTVIPHSAFAEYGCTVKATDGVIDALRVVEGVECAVLLYETGNPSEYKLSLRTNSDLDVSRIATSFGGGGHVKAAGATVTGTVEEILSDVCSQAALQWEEMGRPKV